MPHTIEELFESLALYQVEDGCRRWSGFLKQTKFGNTDYKSIKEILLGISYMDAEGYSSDSMNVFKNDILDYNIYKTGSAFNLFKNLDDYKINLSIFDSRPTLKNKIQKNFEYGKILDEAIENPELGRNDSALLALIAKRSNSLFKGITHRTIPSILLDEYGIIKNGSELKIPFYNSTTTNIALAICFAFYTPMIHIRNPDLSGYQFAPMTSLLKGGKKGGVGKAPSFIRPPSFAPPSFIRPPTVIDRRRETFNISDVNNRIPRVNPKKLIDFVDDEHYINTQEKIKDLNVGGGKKNLKKRKGGAVLFKDSGHFFIINEIDPSLYAFDFFDFMLYGKPENLRDKYFEQTGFIAEQEILFSRLTKFSNINFLGVITSVNKDCSITSSLQDGEISLCVDGCLYNNKGKLSCSINILGQNGLEDIKFYYGPQTTDLGNHMSQFTPSTDAILGIKVYSCKLYSADNTIIEQQELIIDDISPHLNLLTTGEYIVFNDNLNNLPVEEATTIIQNEIEPHINNSSKKAKKIIGTAARVLKEISDIVENLEKVCQAFPSEAERLGRSACIFLRGIVGETRKFEYGGVKMSKMELIEKIAKINPYIKCLSKMKKERLMSIYNQLVILHKYKKAELIKKYKIKNKNLKKNEIIAMIFNSSNK